MKKLTLPAIIAVLSLASSCCFAGAAGPYAGGSFLGGFVGFFGGTVHAGYAINEYHGIHLESGYLGYSQAKASLRHHKKRRSSGEYIPLLVNYQFTYEFENQFFLYTGLGAGVCWIREKSRTEVAGTGSWSTKTTGTLPLGQVRAGCGYRFNDTVRMSAGLRLPWLMVEPFIWTAFELTMAEVSVTIHF